MTDLPPGISRPATSPLESLVASFDVDDPLRERVLRVLSHLPEDVQQDFVTDARFSITRLNFQLGKGSKFCIALPSADGRASRCVALKPRLADCHEPFGLYVIAHELAHAFLRNGPWGKILDKEEAADALAAHWGFPRPIA